MAENQRVEGYTLLSHFMSKHEYGVFRLFQPLAARDLLFMQAELAHLDHEYKLLEKQDRAQSDDTERHWYDRNWRLLSTAGERPAHVDVEKGCAVGSSGKQWEKALEIRSKLKDYCKTNLASNVGNLFR